MKRRLTGPITLSTATFFYLAAVLLVILPVIFAVVSSPMLDNYWCGHFEIPEYGRRFGFTMGALQFTGIDGNTHTELGMVSVEANGIFARAGVRVGDVPRMQHGASSLCAALGAASEGYRIHLSVLNVLDLREGQGKRREITIDLPSQ